MANHSKIEPHSKTEWHRPSEFQTCSEFEPPLYFVLFQHFGHRFVYGSNSIDTASNEEPFPSEWDPILQRALQTGLLPYIPDQASIPYRYL